MRGFFNTRPRPDGTDAASRFRETPAAEGNFRTDVDGFTSLSEPLLDLEPNNHTTQWVTLSFADTSLKLSSQTKV